MIDLCHPASPRLRPHPKEGLSFFPTDVHLVRGGLILYESDKDNAVGVVRQHFL